MSWLVGGVFWPGLVFFVSGTDVRVSSTHCVFGPNVILREDLELYRNIIRRAVEEARSAFATRNPAENIDEAIEDYTIIDDSARKLDEVEKLMKAIQVWNAGRLTAKDTDAMRVLAETQMVRAQNDLAMRAVLGDEEIRRHLESAREILDREAKNELPGEELRLSGSLSGFSSPSRTAEARAACGALSAGVRALLSPELNKTPIEHDEMESWGEFESTVREVWRNLKDSLIAAHSVSKQEYALRQDSALKPEKALLKRSEVSERENRDPSSQKPLSLESVVAGLVRPVDISVESALDAIGAISKSLLDAELSLSPGLAITESSYESGVDGSSLFVIVVSVNGETRGRIFVEASPMPDQASPMPDGASPMPDEASANLGEVGPNLGEVGPNLGKVSRRFKRGAAHGIVRGYVRGKSVGSAFLRLPGVRRVGEGMRGGSNGETEIVGETLSRGSVFRCAGEPFAYGASYEESAPGASYRESAAETFYVGSGVPRARLRRLRIPEYSFQLMASHFGEFLHAFLNDVEFHGAAASSDQRRLSAGLFELMARDWIDAQCGINIQSEIDAQSTCSSEGARGKTLTFSWANLMASMVQASRMAEQFLGHDTARVFEPELNDRDVSFEQKEMNFDQDELSFDQDEPSFGQGDVGSSASGLEIFEEPFLVEMAQKALRMHAGDHLQVSRSILALPLTAMLHAYGRYRQKIFSIHRTLSEVRGPSFAHLDSLTLGEPGRIRASESEGGLRAYFSARVSEDPERLAFAIVPDLETRLGEGATTLQVLDFEPFKQEVGSHSHFRLKK